MNLPAFLSLTIVLGGAGAFVAGRTLAARWRTPAMVCAAALPLSGAVRFLHYALAGEGTDAVSAVVTYGVLLAVAAAGFAQERRAQMARQYPWLTH